MNGSIGLKCRECGQEVATDGRHRCDGGAPGFEFVYDADALRERFEPGGSVDDVWRYADFLPVDGSDPVTLGEGGTDLLPARRLGAQLGIDLFLKREGANPSGSTKDRGTSVAVTHASERGDAAVACASTGNAAASTAAYTARAGLDCALFVPADAPDAKVVQPLVHGADVLAVEGSYDDAYDLCRAVATRTGWLDRSAGANPYTRAGARTLGYELAEQVDRVPDWVVVPMGNGGTIAGVWNGFRTFADLGFVESVPRMLGVQAAGASAIHDGEGGTDTCADSIAVGTPHLGDEARAAIEESGGESVAVADDAIREATARLGRTEGVFAEPACGAAVAGLDLARERGVVDRGAAVVAVITGSGLKDATTAAEAVGQPRSVPADADPERVAARYSSGSE